MVAVSLQENLAVARNDQAVQITQTNTVHPSIHLLITEGPEGH